MIGINYRLAVAIATLATAMARGQTADDARAKQVDALFAPYSKSNAPGGAIGIYFGGKPVYARGFGLADMEQGTPNTPDTLFHIASDSKQFTGLAIALLARDGKIDLDKDIRSYLPWVPDFGVTVTVRNLLWHTSGIRDQQALFELGGHDHRGFRSRNQVVQLIERQRSLSFAPGTDEMYSNSNYFLLGEIVKAVSGQSLRQFAEERIFRPLGMKHTFFSDDLGEIVPHRANSYALGPHGNWRRVPLNYEFVGPTSLLTTVDDMAKWAGNFSRPVVGDAAMIAQDCTLGHLNDGTEVNYAFGLRAFVMGGRLAINHTGADAGFECVFAYFPGYDFAFFIAVNQPEIELRPIMDKMVDIYIGHGDLDRGWPTAIAAPAGFAGSLDGVYANPELSALQIRASNGDLQVGVFGKAGEKAEFWSNGTFGVGPFFRSHFEAIRDASGAVIDVERVSPRDRTRIRYDKIKPYVPSPSELAEIAGDYHSSEIDTTYTLVPEGNHLVAKCLWTTYPLVLTPCQKDRYDFSAYDLNQGVAIIDRDANGRPVRLRLDTDRVRNFVLTRCRKGQ